MRWQLRRQLAAAAAAAVVPAGPPRGAAQSRSSRPQTSAHSHLCRLSVKKSKNFRWGPNRVPARKKKMLAVAANALI